MQCLEECLRTISLPQIKTHPLPPTLLFLSFGSRNVRLLSRFTSEICRDCSNFRRTFQLLSSGLLRSFSSCCWPAFLNPTLSFNIPRLSAFFKSMSPKYCFISRCQWNDFISVRYKIINCSFFGTVTTEVNKCAHGSSPLCSRYWHKDQLTMFNQAYVL